MSNEDTVLEVLRRNCLPDIERTSLFGMQISELSDESMRIVALWALSQLQKLSARLHDDGK